MAERPRSAQAIQAYNLVRAELEKIAAGGQVREITPTARKTKAA